LTDHNNNNSIEEWISASTSGGSEGSMAKKKGSGVIVKFAIEEDSGLSLVAWMIRAGGEQ
jgi:hypothetical protein